jgi:PHD/YefM family antitoxin component YafN of YafNO toxin-antitoxin module
MPDFMPKEPALYANFPSCTSKHARDNLPALVDEVAATGRPVIIKKLSLGRAALTDARELWMHEVIEILGMDRNAIDRPIDEVLKEMRDKIAAWLRDRAAPSEAGQGGGKEVLNETSNLGNGGRGPKDATQIEGGTR